MSNIILREYFAPDVANLKPLTEGDENQKDKKLYLNGIVMQANSKNRNRRIYPISEIVQAVKDIDELIVEYGGAAGELDHPENRLGISAQFVSHSIQEIHMDGDNALAKILILNTPMGNTARGIIDGGIRLGVSSRGSGNVNEGLVSGFKINALDLVSTPSCMVAVPKTVYESVMDYDQNANLLDLAEAINHDDKAQKYFKNEIMLFIRNSALNRS